MDGALITALKVGIIGGKGQLGAWCARLFQERGCYVVIADLSTEVTNRSLIDQVDVVVVSVPIGVTGSVLEEISGAVTERHLLVDLTSVKTPFIPIMERTRAEVLSLHPMFAPDLTAHQGQSCVVCRVRTRSLSPLVERVLSDAGLVLAAMTPEQHDRTMAVVQGLTHFQAIAAAHCMAEIGFNPLESLASASPVYQLRLSMIGRILAQNARLYAEIQIFNPYVREVIGELQRSNEKLLRCIETQDVDRFVVEFERVREKLGPFASFSRGWSPQS